MTSLETLRLAGKIRLDAEESRALACALEGISGEAWLFGSRTNPEQRGGDVDILLLTDQPAFETSQAVATRFYRQCEERIDVIVFNPKAMNAEQQAFLDHITRVRIA